MKKIYLPLLLCALFSGFFSSSITAQDACQPGLPPVASAVNVNNVFCVVYGDRLAPGSVVLLLDVNLQPIGSGTADPTGFVSIVYDCDQTPYRMSAYVEGVGFCNVLVPPQAFLPMKLTNFTAEISRSNTVVLNWTSEIELSSFKYVVQKSDDGKNFTDIGDIKAAGNSTKSIKYNFADINFNGGVSYFRLKQVDVDGKFEYSRVVYVNSRKSLGLVKSVAPNPFTSDVQLIGITSSEVINKNIRVFNSFGQQVSYRITGANSIAIDASAPQGVYYLRFKDQTFKLFKN
jgi:hypothetical protein